MGHILKQRLSSIVSNNLIGDPDEMKDIKPTNSFCEPCVFAEQTRLPFNQAKDKAHITRPLQIVSSDVCGPVNFKTNLSHEREV